MCKNLLCGILILMGLYSQAFCFDDQQTHPQITVKAISSSNLETYLMNNLGFTKGLDSKFPADSTDPKNTVKELMKKGSTDEDTTPTSCRASNHFHNPTKPWKDAGLSGDQGPLALGVDAACLSTGYNLKLSNIIWGTGFESPTGPKTGTINTRDWSTTRYYYLNALTSSSAKERETYFALSFYSLGHVMHLLQDMAVPAHVRNDFKSHFYKRRDSSFVDKASPSTYTANPFEDYMKDSKNWGLITGIAPLYDLTNVPVTRFWDTDTYNGYSTSIQTVGLSEYTNANFFSENTIFSENKDPNDVRYFAHPAKNETDANHIEEIVAKDSKIDKRRYVYKQDTGINVAAYGYFNKTLANSQNGVYWPSDISEGLNYTLDDDIYKGYAAVLMPTVIGYSAGLLNYFFRGAMDMYEDPQSPGTFIIENKSGEDMKAVPDSTEGTFSLYYDDSNGNRYEIKEWSLYNKNVNISAHNELKGVSFTQPNPAPQDNKYILVFKGTLGQESNAVVGKVVSFTPVGPYIKITEVKASKDENGNDNWFTTISLKGDKSTDVHIMDKFDSRYTFSQPVIRDLDYYHESSYYGTLAMDFLMRWNLSNGGKVNSLNDGIMNTLVVEHSTALPRAQITHTLSKGYQTVTSTDDCSEYGQIYGSLGTWKTFYSLGRADWFVGQPSSVWGSGKWDKKLVSAFGYTQEELSQLPEANGTSGITAIQDYYGRISVVKVDYNVQLGTYSYDKCMGEYTEQLIDSMPYPEVGTSNEVIYEIINNNSKLNSWTLKLIAE